MKADKKITEKMKQTIIDKLLKELGFVEKVKVLKQLENEIHMSLYRLELVSEEQEKFMKQLPYHFFKRTPAYIEILNIPIKDKYVSSVNRHFRTYVEGNCVKRDFIFPGGLSDNVVLDFHKLNEQMKSEIENFIMLENKYNVGKDIIRQKVYEIIKPIKTVKELCSVWKDCEKYLEEREEEKDVKEYSTTYFENLLKEEVLEN